VIRHLFVMDPIASVNPAKDTTFDFMLEAQGRGDEVHTASIHDLAAHGARGSARAFPTTVRRPTAADRSHFAAGAPADRPFDDFDVIWMRKDPPVDDAFLLACMILDRADPAKTVMMNDPRGLRIANEKLWGLFADDVGPRTVVSARPDVLLAEVQRLGKAVVKPVQFMGGMGVMVFDKDDRNVRSAIDLLTQEGRRVALVQEYLPGARQGDKRVILIGGDPIGAVLRVPRGDDHRANLHVGGTAAKAVVDDDVRRIAARLKPHLLALGLHFVGLDVIQGMVTEVNVTSPTGVQEIDALDGRAGADRMSAQVFAYVDGLLAQRGAR
jgi:glutathione synthase